ncbi:hypothetical protein Sjap_010766 [Stephania japonica]|uniref:Endopeptidase S2P n=1 Tax=Stephania japonica TaxID=461633 RepID=A0AAP0JA75_9MAGN
MMVNGRRVRRSSRRGSSNAVLPLQNRNHQLLSPSISCWYCDFKVRALNDLLYTFGRKHARFLRFWFSIGVGFSLASLLVVALILFFEFSAALHLYTDDLKIKNLYVGFLFGSLPSPLVPGFKLSLIDGMYLVFSTLVSVIVHEFGHAISAASEGVQIEYIAVFLAVLFPGALVAFDLDILRNLPLFSTLRIYCAGIWHNAVCCADCALTLLLLPLIIYPLYIHGDNLLVLDVTPKSPLSGYLSPGDIIVSLDGMQVHGPQEWVDMMVLINKQAYQSVAHTKGYCVPSSWAQDRKAELEGDQFSCPGELTVFSVVPCLNLTALDGESRERGHMKSRESMHCLTARDVVQHKKCGNGWLGTATSGNTCPCTEEESCSTPVLTPGHSWVEIKYASPFACSSQGNNSTDVEAHNSGATKCQGTFVFVGDVLTMANSVQLTAYQPRWTSNFGLNLPSILEKTLACTFHVSLTLALLNSLPVFFLDGECILEVSLSYVPWLNARKKRQVLQIFLWGGTLSTILAFFIFILHGARSE